MKLVTKDSKGKIRVVEIDYIWNDEIRGYIIHRKTYQYGGKITIQPDIQITRGKVNRTVSEQVRLEFNSHIKKYKDKGYKELPQELHSFEEISTFIDEVMPDGVTDTNGFKKFMLAKQADKVSASTFERPKFWYASRKIDGVRMGLYYKDGKVLTASRGGGEYKYSTLHLTKHPKLIEFFKRHPDIVLDGELYKHGKSLAAISGAARLERNTVDWLEYYVYDIIDSSLTFSERLDIINNIRVELELGFDPNREWEEGDLQIQIVPQDKVSGWLNIKKLHDKYIAEGWEGCVIRDPNKKYKYGGRGNEMIKCKMYLDAEFRITGISEGLRDEDMCFTLVTRDGKEFKAKPMGSREIKEQYRRDLYNLIGKMATVKYFYLSEDGIPLQPVLKAIRDYDSI